LAGLLEVKKQMTVGQQLGGIKTQQGYIREDIAELKRQIAHLRFGLILIATHLCVLYATIILWNPSLSLYLRCESYIVWLYRSL